jgi:hypothetical protein
MTNAFGVLLDSGVLWLGIGAVISVEPRRGRPHVRASNLLRA